MKPAPKPRNRWSPATLSPHPWLLPAWTSCGCFLYFINMLSGFSSFALHYVYRIHPHLVQFWAFIHFVLLLFCCMNNATIDKSFLPLTGTGSFKRLVTNGTAVNILVHVFRHPWCWKWNWYLNKLSWAHMLLLSSPTTSRAKYRAAWAWNANVSVLAFPAVPFSKDESNEVPLTRYWYKLWIMTVGFSLGSHLYMKNYIFHSVIFFFSPWLTLLNGRFKLS